MNGANHQELGYAGYVMPERLIFSASYSHEWLKHFGTGVSLFYEGGPQGRFSYTYTAAVLNDGGSTSGTLIYVPRAADELTFKDYKPTGWTETYTATQQATDFWNYINQDAYLRQRKGRFAERDGAMLTELQSAGHTMVGQLAAPQSTTIIDKDLKLPSTWKTSLAVDVKLPWGIKGSLEGIYNKDLSSVYVTKLGQVLSGNSVQLVSGNAATVIPTWTSMNIKNKDGKVVTPYMITNSDINGWYYAVTAKLEKNFDHGFSAMVAYTKSANQVVNDAIGDQVTSAYNTNTYNTMGSNTPELGYGTYVAPDRVVANVNYRLEMGKHFASTFGLTYEGYQYGYVGGYSYTRNSWVMTNLTGDGGSYQLLYVPTETELASMTFKSDENKAAFWQFIQNNPYLKSRIGQWTERGGEKMPWYNHINFKFMEDFYFNACGKKHNIQVGVDINNLANLLDPQWGNMMRSTSKCPLRQFLSLSSNPCC